MDRYQKIRDALALGPSGGAWQWGGSVCRDNETALAICKEHFDATPLPNENGYFCEVWAEDAKRVALVGHGRNGQNNAQYIAACDPSTIQALLDERDALAVKVASYERADRDLNEALNMGDGSYRP